MNIKIDRRLATTIGLLIVVTISLVLSTQHAFAQGNGRGKGSSSQHRGRGSQSLGNQGGRQTSSGRNYYVERSLAPAQLEQLISLREEEKLAHDVYVTLAQSSGLQIFKNISNAESQHMRAMEQLVARYSQAIPVANLALGKFSNPQYINRQMGFGQSNARVQQLGPPDQKSTARRGSGRR